MKEIKPIETEYRGRKYRSRLEARWAVFFDFLGVNYTYENEGFKLPSGKCYLPDFKIKCYGTRGVCREQYFDLYVEVKGKMTQEDAEKIIEFSGYRPRRKVNEWYEGPDYAQENHILIVGDIPEDGYCGNSEDLHSYENMDGFDIRPWNYLTIDNDEFAAFPAIKEMEDGTVHFYLDGDTGDQQTMNTEIINMAFGAARRKRFEKF